MLFDPKWDAKINADPFSLESLIAWLEKQPADKQYCYMSNGHCLIAQYLTAQGFTNVSLGPYTYRCDPDRNDRKPLPEHWNKIAHKGGFSTFGAALTRARAALAVA